MKKIRIIQAAIMIAFITVLASCGPSYYPTRSSASFSLILGSGIHGNRYHDGRYYYRSPEGYMYWRGYDNRYYLDRSYLGRVHYNKRDYNEWNRGRRRHH